MKKKPIDDALDARMTVAMDRRKKEMELVRPQSDEPTGLLSGPRSGKGLNAMLADYKPARRRKTAGKKQTQKARNA